LRQFCLEYISASFTSAIRVSATHARRDNFVELSGVCYRLRPAAPAPRSPECGRGKWCAITGEWLMSVPGLGLCEVSTNKDSGCRKVMTLIFCRSLRKIKAGEGSSPLLCIAA